MIDAENNQPRKVSAAINVEFVNNQTKLHSWMGKTFIRLTR